MPKPSVKPPCKKSRETLLQVTINRLKHRDRTLTLDRIAEDTNCSPAFLSSLLSTDPPSRPGVNAVQRLYEYLTGTDLTY